MSNIGDLYHEVSDDTIFDQLLDKGYSCQEAEDIIQRNNQLAYEAQQKEERSEAMK